MEYDREQVEVNIVQFLDGIMNNADERTEDRIRAAELIGIIAGVLPGDFQNDCD